MVTAVAFVGAQGDRVVAGTYRGMCVFYATDGLTVLGRMHARSSRGRNAQGSKITGFATASAADSAAADRLLVSSNDSRLRMFLPGERSLERKYKGLANASSQAFARLSSDARYIVSGSEDHNVYVWAAAQDNAATVATHPALDHIRRAGGPLLRAATADGDKSLLGGIFRRRSRRASSISQPAAAAAAAAASASASASAAAAAQSQQQQQDEGSNPKEWESLDGRVEDKSIYEYFAAHDSPVSQALFAPLATLQYLADHEDPILSRPKLRRTAESGDVENLCAPGSDGSFLSSPNAAAAAAAVGGSGSRTVEDMTAIIVSADTSGNIRVFRKDINVRATETSPGAPETSAVEDVAIASAAEDADDSGASTLENSMERRPQSSASHSVMSSTTGGMPRALDRDSSPSFWNRLSRKVTQRRLSSLSGRNHSSSMLSVPSAPVPALPGLRVGEGDCQYCGHHKLIEFAVTASRQSDARIDPLLVCESCKRVKNMPDSINMN
ncbi:hypothetical protein LPJ66_003221 [Kickxella alabastrina]|uniref:Uncharacterized protein n=1 Tax=Kickxella alabastrina TaxID=61397 RepID=A0ACC1ILF3_9FUNG|nr:hypothetical protein LPJ66_003221 [Kickxella alabastrina]